MKYLESYREFGSYGLNDTTEIKNKIEEINVLFQDILEIVQSLINSKDVKIKRFGENINDTINRYYKFVNSLETILQETYDPQIKWRMEDETRFQHENASFNVIAIGKLLMAVHDIINSMEVSPKFKYIQDALWTYYNEIYNLLSDIRGSVDRETFDKVFKTLPYLWNDTQKRRN